MKKPSAKDRILARVAELGYWPPKKQLAQEIGCSPITVTEARRWSERQAEDQRVNNLKNPCQYCQKQEQVSLRACSECSNFLMQCFLLGELTLFLRKDVSVELGPLDLNRAKDALATIVDEWVTRRTQIEVWGDGAGERRNNWRFYEGHQDAMGAGIADDDGPDPRTDDPEEST